MSLAMAPTTAAAMSAVSVDKAGVGSAVLNSMRQVGGSLGIAIMGAVVAQSVGSGPPTPETFTTGFHHAVELAAGFALLGALVAVTTIRKVEHGQPAAIPEGI
jgi:hypothetical protein